MLSRHWLTLTRACTLLVILTSAALLLHYLAPTESGFCGADSGCEAVRKSARSLQFGVPYLIPSVGVGAYVVLLWLSFLPRQRKLMSSAGALGGLIGLGLLVHQAVAVGAFCWLCVTVDVLAIVIAVFCVLLNNTRTPQHEPLNGWIWAGLFGLCINTPSTWQRVKPQDELPQAISRLQQPAALNVFEFVDFQCPHCRRLHPVMRAELLRLSTPVHFQRFHMPLAFHSLASGAARAAVCAKKMGKEEPMADLLFEQPLSEEIWHEHARALGLNAAEFSACLDSESTTKTLAEHAALFRATKEHALPLTFIGGETLRGSASAAVVSEVFTRALTPSTGKVSGRVFVAAILALAAALVGVGWWWSARTRQ